MKFALKTNMPSLKSKTRFPFFIVSRNLPVVKGRDHEGQIH